MDLDRRDDMSGYSQGPQSEPVRQEGGYCPPPPAPPPPPPPSPQAWNTGQGPQQVQQPAKKGRVWRVIWGILFSLSVVANIGLFVLLVGTVFMFAGGRHRGMYFESVIETGPADAKIVVVNLVGAIDDKVAAKVHDQLDTAKHDKAIKGVIVRVDSPGGSVASSDRIYNEIRTFREHASVPVVAFMQGLAASGGYYASVACEKIMAEPTTITGSIGVIMGHFVLQDLLEDKLGIMPVVVKSGSKKDWPSAFKAPTEEQLQYLQDRLIQPAYERFLEVVTEGRKTVLDANEVKALADGGIYNARQALDERLIDRIGYLTDAVAMVKTMASIGKAQVVEYQEAFSLLGLLEGKADALPRLDRKTLIEWSTPQAMYLWQPY